MEIIHNKKNHRFEVVVNGITAHTQYLIENGTLDIRHTIVPDEIGGRGIASKLVEATYAWAKTQNLAPRATCSYAYMWLKKHNINVPSTKDALDGNNCAI